MAALATLVGTLGSLFLAYDYLDDPDSNKENPLRILLRIVVPIIAGMLPGVIVLSIFSTLSIDNFPFLDVIVHVIALGAVAGVASAWFIGTHGERDTMREDLEDFATAGSSRGALLQVRNTLGRASAGLVLGVGSGIVAALILHTTVDNALTTAGSTGPISMALFGVWPLIGWTPTRQEIATRHFLTSWELKRLLKLPLGISALSLYV